MNEPDFWNDKKNSEKIISELNTLKTSLISVENLKKQINDNLETLELLKEENDDEVRSLIEEEITSIDSLINNLEVSLLLSDEYDSCDTILEIHKMV